MVPFNDILLFTPSIYSNLFVRCRSSESYTLKVITPSTIANTRLPSLISFLIYQAKLKCGGCQETFNTYFLFNAHECKPWAKSAQYTFAGQDLSCKYVQNFEKSQILSGGLFCGWRTGLDFCGGGWTLVGCYG